jgi:autotransporter-associated beta strand protein
VGVIFQLPSRVQSRLRRTVADLLSGAVLAAAILVPVTSARALTYLWGGAGSTTNTTDYNLGTNWENPPAGAPPVTFGQGASFDTTGSTSVNVTGGPITPNTLFFTGSSQSYTLSGSDINLSLAGIAGGVIDYAGFGQTISIANNIGESVAGVRVQQQGFSTLILSGTNTYSGGTTISSGGLLQVTNNSSVGSGVVTLDSGTFQADGLSDLKFTNNFKLNTGGGTIDANGIALTISGNITDVSFLGALTVVDSSGSGRVILTGANTYTGGTTICSCATLQLGDATHIGSIVGAVTNENVFDIVNANTAGITSINNDGGITTFFGANSASSIAITNRNGGETDFGVAAGTDTATAGNATIVNRSGGVTAFFATTTAGSATITNRFSGETAFLENSTAGNATIVNRFGGLTLFLDSSNAGNANITNRFGGTTLFAGNSSAGNATITNNSFGGIFAPPIGLGFFEASTAGTATIINNNNGLIAFGIPFGGDTSSADHAIITNNAGSALEFNAFTTAGNATITNNGASSTDFFDSSTAGNATIVTNAGGTTYFHDSANGGNAAFITVGTGFVDFSGSLGPNGDGRITAGSIAGSGIYYIGAGKTLVVGSNNLSTEVSGVIADFNPCGCGSAGPGALTKVGTGNLILSGINTYTGATVVDGGKLIVNGSILSSSGVTVSAGGTLGGNGMVGNTTINGGALAPGNSIGLLTVQGSLVFTAASSYMVEVSPVNADRTNVAGTATLGGATVNASFAAGSYVAKQYTILNAAGGLGGSTFNTLVNTNLPANFKSSLSYDANNAYLNLALVFVPPPGSGLNVNQQNVGNAIVGFFNSNGGIPLVFGGLTPAGLTQISGEPATGAQQATFDAMNIFLGLLTDPFVAGRGDGVTGGAGATPFAAEGDRASAYAAKGKTVARDAFAKFPTKPDAARNNLFDQRWSMWGAAYGGGSTTDGNAALGSNTATARAFGFVAGADYRISPATLAGFALAGGGTNFSVNGLGSGRSDMFQAGAFVRHNIGAAYVSAAAAYAWQDVTTDRTVTVAGIDRLRAEFNANAWSGRLEGGYRFATPWMGITPYAAGQFTTFSLPAYAEQVLAGAGTFALNYAAKDVTASRSELGLRTDRSFAMQDAILTLRGRAAWAHNFNTDRNISAVFQTLPGASFVVNGAVQARDSALTTASAEMKWLNGWSAAATFEGEFSDVTRSYAGKGVVRYAW